jgi:hypothetical protein
LYGAGNSAPIGRQIDPAAVFPLEKRMETPDA